MNLQLDVIDQEAQPFHASVAATKFNATIHLRPRTWWTDDMVVVEESTGMAASSSEELPRAVVPEINARLSVVKRHSRRSYAQSTPLFQISRGMMSHSASPF